MCTSNSHVIITDLELLEGMEGVRNFIVKWLQCILLRTRSWWLGLSANAEHAGCKQHMVLFLQIYLMLKGWLDSPEFIGFG